MTDIEWKSPLKVHDSGEPYREYRDDFLLPLGLERHEGALRSFWPRNGPQWDGLGVARSDDIDGYVLVEAKAYPEEAETRSTGKAEASVDQIRAAFKATQDFMGVPRQDWSEGYYQLANRLAFLYFLNEQVGVSTWLVLVNFLDDRTHRPTDLSSWLAAYQANATPLRNRTRFAPAHTGDDGVHAVIRNVTYWKSDVGDLGKG